MLPTSVSLGVECQAFNDLPGAGNRRLKPLVPRVQHAQAQTIGAEVFAGAVCDMDELGVDPVGKVQGQDRREWDWGRGLGILEHGIRVDLVADEVEFVLPAEACNFLDCFRRLTSVSCGHFLYQVWSTCVASPEWVMRAQSSLSVLESFPSSTGRLSYLVSRTARTLIPFSLASVRALSSDLMFIRGSNTSSNPL